MADTYPSFQELEAREVEDRDWSRTYSPKGTRVLVMAPHGGWIEPFTSELARAIAGEDFSFYTFQGLKEKGNQHLHITSHLFDEPLALGAVAEAHHVVAIHGERSGGEAFVMVGGKDEGLREALVASLRSAGFPLAPPRPGLGGLRPDNICNRGISGQGVQLEISEAFRRSLRQSIEERARFVKAVREPLLVKEKERDGG